jgi:hypothetical protein
VANAQIATSVTILNSLKGFMALSLTNFTTSSASAIAQGSIVEVVGAYFNFSTDETINASSWTAISTGSTAYIALTPSGTAGSMIVTAAWQSTVPVWDTSKQGWYVSAASNIRVVASAYKKLDGSYSLKSILDVYDQKGSAYSDNKLGILHHFTLDNTTSKQLVSVTGIPGAGSAATVISVWGTAGVPTAATAIKCKTLLVPYSLATGVTSIRMAFSDSSTVLPIENTAHPFIGLRTYSPSAAFQSEVWNEIDILLNSSGQFYPYIIYNANSSTSQTYYGLYCVGYYMG